MARSIAYPAPECKGPEDKRIIIPRTRRAAGRAARSRALRSQVRRGTSPLSRRGRTPSRPRPRRICRARAQAPRRAPPRASSPCRAWRRGFRPRAWRTRRRHVRRTGRLPRSSRSHVRPSRARRSRRCRKAPSRGRAHGRRRSSGPIRPRPFRTAPPPPGGSE